MSPKRGTRVLGYVRVSTDDQHTSCEAQRERIVAYCELYGLELVDVVVDEGVSGRTLDRPGLTGARELLASGQVDGLVVAKLDRLTRAVADLGQLLEELDEAGWSLCSVADQIDTRSAAGRLMLNVLTSVAQWEREAISERTKAALAVKRAQGVRLGRRPEPVDEAVVARVRALKAEGRSLDATAVALNEEGLAAPRGGKWYATTVQRMLR